MNSIHPIETEHAPTAIGPYQQAVQWNDLIFCSGQIALAPGSGGELVAPDAAAQTKQVLDNLTAVLSAAGSTPQRILKSTIYLTDLADFGLVNGLYGSWLGDHRPARATVGVASLPRGAKVEIDCIAVREQR